MRKHTNVGKVLKLRGARVIYRVKQITHRTITTNKWDQVIVFGSTQARVAMRKIFGSSGNAYVIEEPF
jgi:hypothetical protein